MFSVYISIIGACGGTVLQAGRSWVRFPMVSIEFFIDIIKHCMRENLKSMDNVKEDNGHVYCNTPITETFKSDRILSFS
jgi:hypothetical protein